MSEGITMAEWNQDFTSPKEWAKEKQLTDVQVKLILEALDVDRKYRLWCMGRKCAICDVSRTAENAAPFHYHHFNATCKEHQFVDVDGIRVEVAQAFNLEIIRTKLGLPPRPNYFDELL